MSKSGGEFLIDISRSKYRTSVASIGNSASKMAPRARTIF
jgi:hypothetical protein